QGQDERGSADPEATDVRIRIGFNNLTLTATLSDNPTALDLASMLPLNLKIEDYGTNLATCLAGIGIAQVFSLGMADYLNNGQLV
ncbi:cyclophilin-like fold protein, partial [Rhizobium ruizarguesonis]